MDRNSRIELLALYPAFACDRRRRLLAGFQQANRLKLERLRAFLLCYSGSPCPTIAPSEVSGNPGPAQTPLSKHGSRRGWVARETCGRTRPRADAPRERLICGATKEAGRRCGRRDCASPPTTSRCRSPEACRFREGVRPAYGSSVSEDPGIPPTTSAAEMGD
jgi:hypothetical protein